MGNILAVMTTQGIAFIHNETTVDMCYCYVIRWYFKSTVLERMNNFTLIDSPIFFDYSMSDL